MKSVNRCDVSHIIQVKKIYPERCFVIMIIAKISRQMKQLYKELYFQPFDKDHKQDR
jgi:hypothetical protein